MCVFDSTCICFSASPAPGGRLSPWTHWTILSLSHGFSHPHLCTTSPFSLSLYLSLGLPEMCVGVCVCVYERVLVFMREKQELTS